MARPLAAPAAPPAAPLAAAGLEDSILADLKRIHAQLLDLYPLPPANFDVEISATEDEEGASASTSAIAPVEGEEPDFVYHGHNYGCRVTIYPPGVKDYRDVKKGIAPAYDLGFLAHELYHCMQYEYYPDIALRRFAPKFLVEGSAEWAENKWIYDTSKTPYETALPGEYLPTRAGYWDRYLGEKSPAGEENHPLQYSLYEMVYSAVGFYANLENVGIDPWRAVPDMIRAVRFNDRDANNGLALEAVVPDENTAEFWQNWATSFVRIPDLGPTWDTTGPGITKYRRAPTKHQLDVSGGDVDLVTLRAAAERHQLNFGDTTNAVLTTRTDAYGRFAWVSSPRQIVQARFGLSPDGPITHNYCLDSKGCTCEDGTPIPTTPPVEPPPAANIRGAYVAFTGALGRGTLAVALTPADEFCDDPAGHFQHCSVITETQVRDITGNPTMRDAGNSSKSRVCLWTSFGDVDETLVLAGSKRSSQIPSWEKFSSEFTSNGADCTQIIGGLRGCIVEEEDNETAVYAWAGLGNGAVASIVAGRDRPGQISTPAGRLEALNALVLALRDDDPE